LCVWYLRNSSVSAMLRSVTGGLSFPDPNERDVPSAEPTGDLLGDAVRQRAAKPAVADESTPRPGTLPISSGAAPGGGRFALVHPLLRSRVDEFKSSPVEGIQEEGPGPSWPLFLSTSGI
jgi:hypothetical protein